MTSSNIDAGDGVRLYGDWEKLEQWAIRLKTRSYMDKFRSKLRKLGGGIRERVKAHIEQQDLPWPPLASSTIARKGFSTIYVEKGDYYRKINVRILVESEDTITLFIGPWGRHPSGLQMQTLGAYLEFGTSQTPARPLWRPTFEEMKDLPAYKDLLDLGAIFSFNG